jgi:cytochrome c-type biogenesis protein CcsB
MWNRRSHSKLPALRADGRRWLAGFIAVAMGIFLQLSAWGGIDQAKPGDTDPHAGMFSGNGNPALRGMTGAAGAGGGMEQNSAAVMAQRFAKQDRTAFEAGIRLDAFRLLAINHLDQLKIIDSWARQSLSKIRNRHSIDGQDPVYTALDMAIRPEAWLDRDIIYVQAIPVREQLTRFATGATEEARRQEADRIMEKGLVSPTFLLQQPVLMMLDNMSRDSTKAAAVGKVFTSIETFRALAASLTLLPPPPGPAWTPHVPWINPQAIAISGSETAPAAQAGGAPPRTASPYTPEQTLKIQLAFKQLSLGWQESNLEMANAGIGGFVAIAPTLDPAHYPTETKRAVELWYNRTFNGTLIAFIYFLAMTLFLMVAVGVVGKAGRLQKWGMATFALAVVFHAAVMGVRWWLAGRIPIQNQFESVLGAALLGCIVGVALEATKRNGIFGVAFSFVGFLAMTTCLAAPYVFGEEMRGAAIEKVAGILTNTAWLYIHVNIVIASYALIFAGAVIGSIYLGLRLWHWINPVEPGSEDEGAGFGLQGSGGGGGAEGGGGGGAVALQPSLLTVSEIEKGRAATLDMLDQANMVVLQMAMWLLGIGIMCGAVWADRSWGRPWGWDPKETFALVTWIVYLIIVHVRFVTRAKADWSAALAVVGCAVMLFNWIGVNFFLKGLHSYA